MRAIEIPPARTVRRGLSKVTLWGGRLRLNRAADSKAKTAGRVAGRGGAGVPAAGRFVVLAAGVALGSGPEAAGGRALGEFLASECVACHQPGGRFAGIPPI